MVLVSGTGRQLRPAAFANPDSATLAELRAVELDLASPPVRRRYELSDALGLTAETVGDVKLTVKVNGEAIDSRLIRLAVEDDKLVVKNDRGGMVIFIR